MSDTPTIIEVSTKWKIAYGYVAAMMGVSPERAPAFLVQLYVPTAPAKERLQWFSTYEVRDNRELVWVSLLRDAMVHSLPVELTYHETLRDIISIEVRSTIFHAEGERAITTGKVLMISVNEFGLWKEDIDIPDTASIVLSTWPAMSLALLLQSPARETKLAQLDMLQRAYQTQSDVTITYRKTPVMGDPNLTANVIVSVQIGTEPKPVMSPKLPGNKRKGIGKVP